VTGTVGQGRRPPTVAVAHACRRVMVMGTAGRAGGPRARPTRAGGPRARPTRAGGPRARPTRAGRSLHGPRVPAGHCTAHACRQVTARPTRAGRSLHGPRVPAGHCTAHACRQVTARPTRAGRSLHGPHAPAAHGHCPRVQWLRARGGRASGSGVRDDRWPASPPTRRSRGAGRSSSARVRHRPERTPRSRSADRRRTGGRFDGGQMLPVPPMLRPA
jgi:hypothetical protein